MSVTGPGPAGGATGGAARRLLVVEDEPVINQAVTDRLRGEGYDVVQAWDGPGAERDPGAADGGRRLAGGM